MGRLAGIAIGAGVASALLFIVSATASLAAVALAYLTPLPVIIAAMGFGHRTGLAAALIGGGAIALVLGALPGVIFLALLGLPTWWLSYLCLLARPLPQGGAEWYPVSTVVLWTAILSAAPVLVAGLLLLVRFGGYEATIDGLAARLAAIFDGRDLPGGLSYDGLVRMAPLAIAASTVLMLSFNLWLGGRIVLLSHRLARPWPVLADAIRLPRGVAVALAALLAAAFLPGPLGLAAEVAGAALGMVFVFEGLAATHVLTRGLSGRRMILGGVYAAVFVLMPYPLVALALIGCLDCLFALRSRRAAPPPQHPTTRS